MKPNIHPQYYKKAEVTCACGHRFFVGSTKPVIKVEICSKCHPHFTGADKFIDKRGRVDKFVAKISKYQELLKETEKRKKEKMKKAKEAEIILRQKR